MARKDARFRWAATREKSGLTGGCLRTLPLAFVIAVLTALLLASQGTAERRDSDANGPARAMLQAGPQLAYGAPSVQGEPAGKRTFTVDFEHDGVPFSMAGRGTITISELLQKLKIAVPVASVQAVAFSDPSLVSVERTGDDWLLRSLKPFSTNETLNVTLADGSAISIHVTDAEYTADLTPMFTTLEVYKNGELMDLGRPVIIREDDRFQLILVFQENDNYQFMNDDTIMNFQMPSEFHVPEGFEVMIDVNITVGGKLHTLKNNRVTYDTPTEEGKGGIIHLQWNTADAEFAYLKQSSDANVNIDVAGSFEKGKNGYVTFGNNTTIEIATPADAGVVKTGIYDEVSHTVSYETKITADGDLTHPIHVADSLDGAALTYKPESFHATWGDGDVTDETNSAQGRALKGLVDQIKESLTAAGENPRSFAGTLALSSEDARLVSGGAVTLTYVCDVDMNKLNLSSPSPYDENGEIIPQIYDDLGNKVTIDSPLNRYEEPHNNESTYVFSVDFSNIDKTVSLSEAMNGVNAQGVDIRYREATWTVEINTKAEAKIGGEISDTLTYSTDYVTMQLANAHKQVAGEDKQVAGIIIEVYDQQLAGMSGEASRLVETRLVPWTQLRVKRGSETDADENKLSTITWTYKIPESDDSYRYLVTYATRADLADVKVPSTVFNEAHGRPGFAEAEVTLAPPGTEGIGVTKKVVASSLDHIDWQIDVLARTSAYNQYFRVTDSLPRQWIEDVITKKSVKYSDGVAGSLDASFDSMTDEERDAALHSAITITGLQENEKWVGTFKRGNSAVTDRVLISFYKKVGDEWVEGLNEYPVDGTFCEQVTQGGQLRDRRHITIAMRTDNNQTWVEESSKRIASKSWLTNHENKVQVRGDVGDYAFDSALAPIVKPTIIKVRADPVGMATQYRTLSVTHNRGTANEKTVDLPVYNFYVNVGGVRDGNGTIHTDEAGRPYIEIRDTFDYPGIWTLFEAKNYDLGGHNATWLDPKAYYCEKSGYPSESSLATQITDTGQFTYTVNPDTHEVVFRIYNPPKKTQDSYYSFYSILYSIAPEAQDATNTSVTGFDELIQEMSKEEHMVVEATATKSVLNTVNTAQLALTDPAAPTEDNPWPTDTADFTYEYNPTSKSVSYDSANKTATYTVVLNENRVRLLPADGSIDELLMTDTHSANLSVDYSTIDIQTVPADRKNQVSYDYSGNTGTYKIPDETKVTVTYEARLIGDAGSKETFTNTVNLSGFSSTTMQTQTITSVGGSSAGVYQVQVYKYEDGHMETGLGLARFRLLDQNKRPVLNRNGEEITFVSAGSGFSTVTLDESEMGVAIKKNTVYFLQEIETPIAYVEGTDKVRHFKQDPVYYSFLISDNPNYSAPDGVYVYSNGDILKVRNYEDLGGINISKAFAGNVELSEEEKNRLVFRITRKLEGETNYSVYKDIRYSDFRYSDWQKGNGSTITGTIHLDVPQFGTQLLDTDLKPGEYRVTELNADDIDDKDVSLETEYLVDGAVSDTRVFKLSQEDLGVRDPETGDWVKHPTSHNIVVTNTYFKRIYTITKEDSETGARLPGAEFKVYEYKGDGNDEAVDKTYVTNEKGQIVIDIRDKSNSGANLYRANTLYYAVESKAPTAYQLPSKLEKFFFYYTDEKTPGTVTIPDGVRAVDLSRDYGSATAPNDKQTISVPVRKTWANNTVASWLPAFDFVKSVKVGLYQQEEGVAADPTPVLAEGEPLTCVLTPEHPEDTTTFANLPAASKNGKPLLYSVRELAVSFDGETEADPEDTFIVTYGKDQGSSTSTTAGATIGIADKVAEGETPACLTVDNMERGCELTVNKQWYEKHADGRTAQLAESEVADYAKSFRLFRTTGDRTLAPSSQAVNVTTSGSGDKVITPESETTFHPGDTISVRVCNVGAGYHSFDLQYKTTDNSAWQQFVDDEGASPFKRWKDRKEQDFTFDVTLDPERTYTGLFVCNWSAGTTVEVTLTLKQRGSTWAGAYGQESAQSLESLAAAEPVADFDLPDANGNWSFHSDTLSKRDENGNEYAYWVVEQQGDESTVYQYRDGVIDVKNYQDMRDLTIGKEWVETTDESQKKPILFDLYRTTEVMEGASNRRDYTILYNKDLNYDKVIVERSDPGPISVQAGDVIRLSFTVGVVPNEIIFNGKNQTYADRRSANPSLNWFSAQFAVQKNARWEEDDRIFSGGSWWNVANEGETSRTFTFDYTLQDKDLAPDSTGKEMTQFYIRAYNFPAEVHIQVVKNGQSLTHEQMVGYATHPSAELVRSGIQLDATSGWTHTTPADLKLPVTSPEGLTYTYFPVERIPDGFGVAYEQKLDGATLQNTYRGTADTGGLKVTKSVADPVPEGLGDKGFFFTLSKDGYYYKTDGSYETSADTCVQSIPKTAEGYGTVEFANLPVGEYTITELTDRAKLPNYALSSKVFVSGSEASGGKVGIAKDQVTQATIQNVYTPGAELTSVSVQKGWGGIAATDALRADDAAATFVLRRYLQEKDEDGHNIEDEFDWIADEHQATLDGMADDDAILSGKVAPWKYVWGGLPKVYWTQNEQGDWVENPYIYKVEEKSITYDGVETDLTEGPTDSWATTVSTKGNDWTFTNTPNLQLVSVRKEWRDATSSLGLMEWPELDGSNEKHRAYLPVSATLHKALVVPGEERRVSKDTLAFTLVPDNDQLAELNAQTGYSVRCTKDDGRYVFTVNGLPNTGAIIVNNKLLEGTWEYWFTEQLADDAGFSRIYLNPETGEPDLEGTYAPNGGTIRNRQKAATTQLAVTKALTLGDGVTEYTGAWPAEGFTFTVATDQGDQSHMVVDPSRSTSVATGGNHVATFEPGVVTFTKEGTYTLGIAETGTSGDPNIVRDTSKHTATVRITSHSGKLEVESVRYDVGTAGEENQGTAGLTVTNRYSRPGEVTFKVRKTLIGSTFQREPSPFSFRLTQVEANNSTAQATNNVKLAAPVVVSTQGKRGSVCELAFDTNLTFDVSNVGTEYWFMLEEVLPDGVDASATDKDHMRYDTSRRWVKVEVEQGDTGLRIKKNGSLYDSSSPGNDAEFTNTKLVDVTATKRWVANDGTTAITPPDGAYVIVRLTRWQGLSQDTSFGQKTLALGTTTPEQGADFATVDWSYAWENMPKSYLDSDQTNEGDYLDYEYRVEEIAAYYQNTGESAVAQHAVANDMTSDGRYLVDAIGGTVTNRLNTKNVEFGKQWRDETGVPTAWPAGKKISVTLKRVGDNDFAKPLELEPSATPQTVGGLGVSWTTPQDVDTQKIYWFQIADLPRFKADGYNEWRYYVVENGVAYDDSRNYVTTYSAEPGGAFERTSSSRPKQFIANYAPTTNLTVSKEWRDAASRIVSWPAEQSVTLKLYRRHAGDEGAASELATFANVHPGATVTSGGYTAECDEQGTISIAGLEAFDTAAGEPVRWVYFVRETSESATGYDAPTYGNRGDYIALTDAAYQRGVIRNKRTETSISFTKVWKNAAGTSIVWPGGKSIAITLNAFQDGDASEQPVLGENGAGTPFTLTPTLHEGWSVSEAEDGTETTFTHTGLPLYDDEGHKLVYFVTEEAGEGYATPLYLQTRDGAPSGKSRALDTWSIENHPKMSARATVNLVATKSIAIVKGRGTPRVPADGEFSFLAQLSPEGDQTGVDRVRIEASNDEYGEVRFGLITFKKPGNYTFQVTETSTNRNGYVTDTSVYVVTYAVGEDMSVTRMIHKDTSIVGTIAFENTYQAERVEVDFSGTKTLTYGSQSLTLDDGRFGFTVAPAAGNPAQGADESSLKKATARNAADGSIDFGSVTYTMPGTWSYVVREDAIPATSGILADGREYAVTVTVADNGSGKLTASVTGDGDARTPSDVDGLAFVNEQLTGEATMSVHKVVDGGGPVAMYPFVLSAVSNDAGVETPTPAAVRVAAVEGGSATFGPISYTVPGTYYYTIAEEAGSEPNMHYDTAPRYVKVVVSKDDAGRCLRTDVSYSDDEAGTHAEKSYTTTVPTVTNRYTRPSYEPAEATLTATKTIDVTGGRGSAKTPANGQFTFEARLTAGDTTGVDKTQLEATNDGYGIIDFGTIKFTKPGSYAFEVEETGVGRGGYTDDATVYTVTYAVDETMGITHTIKKGNDVVEAVAFRNAYEATSVTVPFSGSKTLLHNETQLATPAGEFVFTVVPAAGNPAGADETHLRTEEFNGADGSIVFGNVTYTVPGTWTYTVSERATPAASGVRADSSVHVVVVEVSDDGVGHLVAAVTVDGVASGSAASGLNFTNTQLEGTATLQVRKRVEGDTTAQTFNGNEEFTFSLSKAVADQVGDELPADATVVTRASDALDASGALGSFVPITYTQPGTYYYDISESVGSTSGMFYDHATRFARVEVTRNDASATLETHVSYSSDAQGEVADKSYADDLPTIVNVYTKPAPQAVSDDLRATKTINGHVPGQGHAFSFSVAPVVEGGWENPVSGIEEGFSSPVINDANGIIDFGAITFVSPGTWKFEVRETSLGGNGITVDPAVFEVTYEVRETEANQLAINKTIKHAGGQTLPVIEFGNAYKTSAATVSLSGTKSLHGGVLADQQFSFELVDGAGEVAQVVANDGEGNYAFEPLRFTSPGTYRFVVRERNGGVAGVEYDSTAYDVSVEVADDQRGALVATTVITEASSGAVVAPSELNFANTIYEGSASLEIEKLVVGDTTGLRDDESCAFVLSKLDAGQSGDVLPDDTRATVSVADAYDPAGHLVTFAPITYNQPGTYYYAIAEEAGNVPGMTYDTAPRYARVEVTKDETLGRLRTSVSYSADTEGDVAAMHYDPHRLVVTNTCAAIPPATAAISITKRIDANVPWQTDKGFEFAIVRDEGNAFTNEILSADRITVKDGETKELQVTYTNPGTYFYVVREIDPMNRQGDDASLWYDTADKYAKVIVTLNAETRTLETSVTYGTSKERCEDAALTVTNTYAAPAIEKYINKDVHHDLPAFDTPFTYDILAFVTRDAGRVVITDPLAKGIRFARGSGATVAVQDIGWGNDHMAHGTVERADGRSIDATVNVDEGRKVLVVEIANAQQQGVAGHWVRVTYNVALDNDTVGIADEYNSNNSDVADNKTVKSDRYPNGDVGHSSHGGVATSASYVIYAQGGAGDVPAYTQSANVVTATPQSVSISVSKAWKDANGEATAWPHGASVTVEVLGNGKHLDEVTTDMFGADRAIKRLTLELTATNASGTFANLPVYEALAYSVAEVGMTGISQECETSITGGPAEGFVVTNTLRKADGDDGKSDDSNNSDSNSDDKKSSDGNGKDGNGNDASGSAAQDSATPPAATASGDAASSGSDVTNNDENTTFATRVARSEAVPAHGETTLAHTADASTAKAGLVLASVGVALALVGAWRRWGHRHD